MKNRPQKKPARHYHDMHEGRVVRMVFPNPPAREYEPLRFTMARERTGRVRIALDAPPDFLDGFAESMALGLRVVPQIIAQVQQAQQAHQDAAPAAVPAPAERAT